MNGKWVFVTSMAAALLTLGVVRGQGMSSGSGSTSSIPSVTTSPSGQDGFTMGANPMYATTTAETKGPPVVGGVYGVSSWLTYPKPAGCCGPVGGNGLIEGEVYLRNGISIPIGGNLFGRELDPGWMVTGGVRSLFFDPSLESAWTVDLSLSFTDNNAPNSATPVPLVNVLDRSTGNIIPSTTVTISNLTRTAVGLAGGKEWYIWGSGDYDGNTPNWRVGVDGGGRFGACKLDFNEIRHFTDSTGGMFFSAHSDFEMPYGTCVFNAGVRTEWSYTWTDILQRQNNTDLQEISLLVTLGVRF
jgi:hypothetical protein